MTLEEESRLSFYRELTVLDEKKNIVLVQDIRNSELCVKKTLDIYSHDVYEQLASVRIEGVPAVKECVADDGKLIVVEEYVQGRSLKQVLDEQDMLMQIRMKIPECWEQCILLHQSSLDLGSLMSVRIYMVWEQQLIIL